MRLYDYGPSQNCYKVRLLASHLSLDLDLVPVAIFQGEGMSPAFLAKNPMGSVPVLETDSGEHLPESNAILSFLAEGTSYLPEKGMPRAQVLRWLMFEQVYVQSSIGLLRYWTLTGKLEKYAPAVPARQALGNRVLDVLNAELGQKQFVAGNEYTIADMSLFSYCHLAADGRFDLSGRIALRAWFERVRQQPGFIGEVVPYSVDPHSGGPLPISG